MGSLAEGPLPDVLVELDGDGFIGVVDVCVGGNGAAVGGATGGFAVTIGPLVLEFGMPAPGVALETAVGGATGTAPVMAVLSLWFVPSDEHPAQKPNPNANHTPADERKPGIMRLYAEAPSMDLAST